MCTCRHCEDPLCRLTPRQRELLQVLAARPGATNRELAHEMCLSESTVKKHLHRIYRTLDVRSRAHCLVYYLSR